VGRWLCVAICAAICSTAAVGENALRVVDGQLLFWNRYYEIWGVRYDAWERLATDPSAMWDTLQPLGEHGVTTVGFSLQNPKTTQRNFTSDGQWADDATAQHFTATVKTIRDHHLSSVVSLFSADRSCWLASPQAYVQAAQSAARQLGKKHSVILVAGDLFGHQAWSDESPYRLDQPAAALAVCRAINDANDEPLVAIPASLVPGADRLKPRPLLFAAKKTELLEHLLKAARQGTIRPETIKGLIVVPADRFFVSAGDRIGTAQQGFLEDVERRRLAVNAPQSQPSDDVPVDDGLTDDERKAGWVSLFDGRSMDGWTALGPDWQGWVVRDGVMVCTGRDGNWLRSRKRYSSFVFRFEFRIGPNGNSGVFIWSPLTGRSSRFGMEMQIRGIQRDVPNDDTTGAIYDALPPSEDASARPNEWNRVEISCRGSRVRIVINDRVVQDFDADQVPQLQHRLRRGVIGLQDHGNEVWFRKLRIKELE